MLSRRALFAETTRRSVSGPSGTNADGRDGNRWERIGPARGQSIQDLVLWRGTSVGPGTEYYLMKDKADRIYRNFSTDQIFSRLEILIKRWPPPGTRTNAPLARVQRCLPVPARDAGPCAKQLASA